MGDQRVLGLGDWTFNHQKVGKEFDPQAAHLEGSWDKCVTTEVPLKKVIKSLRVVISLLKRTQSAE